MWFLALQGQLGPLNNAAGASGGLDFEVVQRPQARCSCSVTPSCAERFGLYEPGEVASDVGG